MHITKPRGEEVQLHTFFVSVPGGGWWSVSRPGRLTTEISAVDVIGHPARRNVTIVTELSRLWSEIYRMRCAYKIRLFMCWSNKPRGCQWRWRQGSTRFQLKIHKNLQGPPAFHKGSKFRYPSGPSLSPQTGQYKTNALCAVGRILHIFEIKICHPPSTWIIDQSPRTVAPTFYSLFARIP